MTIEAEDAAKTCEERALRVVSSKLFPLNPDAADKYELQAALVRALEKVRTSAEARQALNGYNSETYAFEKSLAEIELSKALAECDRIRGATDPAAGAPS